MNEETSKMAQDVAAAHARAAAGSYIGRYEYDRATGALIEKNPSIIDNNGAEIVQEGTKVVAYLRDLAIGSAVSHAMAAANPYTAYLYSQPNALTQMNWDQVWDHNDGKDDFRKAYYYWRKDELVYKCIKFLTQMANARLLVECDNEDFQTIVDTWIETVMPHSFRDEWFRDYFRYNFVATLKALIPYRPRNYKKGKIPKGEESRVVANKTEKLLAKHAQAAREYSDAQKKLEELQQKMAKGLAAQQAVDAQAAIVIEKQYSWLKGMVPAGYTILNPMDIDYAGPKDMEWLRLPHLRITPELRSCVTSPQPQQQSYINALPQEIVSQIKNGKDKVWLSPNICHITTADKQSYEIYPVPMVSHAFDALKLKGLLQLADDRTAQNLRERILKITIGSDKYPVLTQEPMLRLQQIFQNRTWDMAVYWNHTLEIEWVETPTDSFLDKDKYVVLDDRVRTVFGISRIFTGTSDTSGGAIGNNMMNYKSLEEEVSGAQEAMLEFMRKEIDMLKQSLGVGFEVNIRFVKINLRDEAEFITVLQGLVTNGILDPQTALDTLGYHFPTVLKRLRKIKGLRDKEQLFLPLPSSNNMGPDQGIPTGGKPKKAPLADNNKNKRGKSQPKTGKSKAAARFVVISPDQMRLVVDADEITDEGREEVSRAFHVFPEWVISRAEYQQTYGKSISFMQPWPELEPAEAAKAARVAMRALAPWDEKIIEAVVEWKRANASKDSRRGNYVTEKVKEELSSNLEKELLKPYVVDDPDWDTRVAEAMGRLKAADPDMSDREARVQAHVMLSMQHKKFEAAQLAEAA